MLTISNAVKGAVSGRYYTEDARDDYYVNRINEPGRWLGKGAELLGLSGKIQGEFFQNLLDGFTPNRSSPLVQNAGSEKRQCGWDLTFNAPKSVSVLWALSSLDVRKQIEQAHQSAVAYALENIERVAGVTRRGPRGEIKEPAALVFATFQHGTSRALDPHLHTHAVMVNLGLREDGTTGTIQSKKVFQQKMFAGGFYQVELAKALRAELKVAIKVEPVGFHVEGVPRELCQAFSKRRRDIENTLDEWGAKGAVSAKLAALATRKKKQQVAQAQLLANWQKEGEDLGWNAERLRAAVRENAKKHDQEQSSGLPIKAATTKRSKASSRNINEQTTNQRTEGATKRGDEAGSRNMNDQSSSQSFEELLLEAAAEIPPKRRSWLRLFRLAVALAIKMGISAARLEEALARITDDLIDLGMRFPIHVEWSPLFPKAPFWSPFQKITYPAVIVGNDNGKYWRGWGKTRSRRSLVAAELRVQMKRIFSRAPRWSPAHLLKLPALRIDRKPPYLRRWGEIRWQKNLIVCELRVQMKRPFVHAHNWNPASQVEIPALRLARKPPKSKPLNCSHSNEMSH